MRSEWDELKEVIAHITIIIVAIVVASYVIHLVFAGG